MGRDESSDKRKGKKRGESFAELLEEGVRPLPERPEARPRPSPAPARKVAATKVVFEIEHQGEEFQGRAPGVSRRELRRFYAASTEPVREVELHGLTAEEGRAAVRRALGRARKEGGRWLHVIHGRGLRSQDGAVLKRALPGWLAEPPHGGAVLAFVCSRRLAGATGATRVWLRREGPGGAVSR